MHTQLLINGKFEDASGGKTFETYDPRTGEPLMTVAEAQAEDVDRAVKAARQVTRLLPVLLETHMRGGLLRELFAMLIWGIMLT